MKQTEEKEVTFIRDHYPPALPRMRVGDKMDVQYTNMILCYVVTKVSENHIWLRSEKVDMTFRFSYWTLNDWFVTGKLKYSPKLKKLDNAG